LDEPLKREIAGRMGCEIVKVYKDHGVSGDGRCDSGHGKSSGSHHEDSLQACGHRNGDQRQALPLIDESGRVGVGPQAA
jgi:hypothetical protein